MLVENIHICHIKLNIISGGQSNRSRTDNTDARDNETDGKGKRRNWKGISNKSLSHKL